ncbi:MAG: DUF3307 domain-containing protein [Chloroflexota bacterium]
MVVAMFLAHLVGDYILQWDQLALWKSRELNGVLVHGSIVVFITWLFSLPFDSSWLWGVLLIGVTHILIDAAPLYIPLPLSPLGRFVVDQLLHFIVIFLALILGGYLHVQTLFADIVVALQSDRTLTFMLGYAFVTMPTWVLVKFLAYWIVKGSPPLFPGISNKYIGIFERLIITTCVALGQFFLVPIVAAARLALEWQRVKESEQTAVYLVELLVSLLIAVAVGLGLRLIP